MVRRLRWPIRGAARVAPAAGRLASRLPGRPPPATRAAHTNTCFRLDCSAAACIDCLQTRVPSCRRSPPRAAATAACSPAHRAPAPLHVSRSRCTPTWGTLKWSCSARTRRARAKTFWRWRPAVRLQQRRGGQDTGADGGGERCLHVCERRAFEICSQSSRTVSSHEMVEPTAASPPPLCYHIAGYYEGTIFHRNIKAFMIQVGGCSPWWFTLCAGDWWWGRKCRIGRRRGRGRDVPPCAERAAVHRSAQLAPSAPPRLACAPRHSPPPRPSTPGRVRAAKPEVLHVCPPPTQPARTCARPPCRAATPQAPARAASPSTTRQTGSFPTSWWITSSTTSAECSAWPTRGPTQMGRRWVQGMWGLQGQQEGRRGGGAWAVPRRLCAP